MGRDIPEILLLTITKDGIVRFGVPPKHHQDNYPSRAVLLGKLENFSHVLCSLEGEMFCVRGEDLYRGPMLSRKDVDWFSTAKRVGKCDWNKFKFLFFDVYGELCGVTNDGEFYKGPQPNNENVSWMYGEATKIGLKGWEQCEAVTFDLSGNLYVVNKDDKLVKARPPTAAQDYEDWLKTSAEVGGSGWRRLTHFMSFTSDGKLWCVDTEDGNIYRGSIPQDGRYVDEAEHLGFGYHGFTFFSFTKDKTICEIIDCDFFLENWGGPVTSKVIEERLYDNKCSSFPLKQSFTFDTTLTESSSFSHDHEFTFEAGADKFKEGKPILSKGKYMANQSRNCIWSLTGTHEYEVRFSSSSEVEVPPGKVIRVVVSVGKANARMRYFAKVRTLFGFKKVIEGTWNGSIYNNLTFQQYNW